jgi:uncharacterized MAPEG superfamily protein
MTLTIAYGCLLAAFLMPFVCAGIAKGGRSRYDNRAPRQWERSLQGYRLRAVAAEANTFEALPFFAAAVIIAHQRGAPQGTLDALAAVWLALRSGYVALYVADRATARSLVWTAALAVNIWIFVLGG